MSHAVSRFVCAWTALALLSSVASIASAQSTTSAELVEPREPPGYAAAVACSREASRRAEWPEANRCLRDVLAIRPTPRAAFNLGVTYDRMNQRLSAVATYEAVLAGVYGELSEGDRVHLERELASSRSARARVLVRVVGPLSSTLLVDGRRITDIPEREARVVFVDPGTHTVAVRSRTHMMGEEDVAPANGESVRVDFELQPLPLPETLDWGIFWGVGVGVVLVGVAAGVLGYALSTEGPLASGGPLAMSIEI